MERHGPRCVRIVARVPSISNCAHKQRNPSNPTFTPNFYTILCASERLRLLAYGQPVQPLYIAIATQTRRTTRGPCRLMLSKTMGPAQVPKLATATCQRHAHPFDNSWRKPAGSSIDQPAQQKRATQCLMGVRNPESHCEAEQMRVASTPARPAHAWAHISRDQRLKSRSHASPYALLFEQWPQRVVTWLLPPLLRRNALDKMAAVPKQENKL